MPPVVARKLMASRSQQSSANATRTRSPLSQPISKPSEHQRRLRSSTAMRPSWRRSSPGEPADVHAIATEYADWLGKSNMPKLFLKAEPGAILSNDRLVNLVRAWPALTEKTVAGIHFVQEDSPDEIGRAIAAWMAESLGSGRTAA